MKQQYQTLIDACFESAFLANHCAVSCLEEKDVQHLTKCIKLDLECAVICRTTAELLNEENVFSKQILKICADICNACADECDKHAAMGMEHCIECAEACRKCAIELIEAYESLDKETNTATVYQEECITLSRASAELMSLGSGNYKQIAALTAIVCKEYAATADKYLNMQMKNSLDFANIAAEVNQHLEDKVEDTNSNAAEKSKEQVEQKKEVMGKKKKHFSALLSAWQWRSPVHHAMRHSSGGIYGADATTGTNLSYKEEDV